MFVWPTSSVGMLHPAGGAEARARMRDFLAFAEAALAGVSYNDAKQSINASGHQAETRKSLFEELGLLYVPYYSDSIRLTPIGRQLSELLIGADLQHLDAALARKATELLVWAMCRSQINRPQSFGTPKLEPADRQDCDLRPYAAAWLALCDSRLNGRLNLHEFMGPLRRLQFSAQFSDTLETILHGRAVGAVLATPDELVGRGSGMNPRIYWRSHLSVAGQLLSWDRAGSAFMADTPEWALAQATLRFQAGCSDDLLAAMQAEPWEDAEDYFMNVAGIECPPFLASGSPKLATFEGSPLADLRPYSGTPSGSKFRVTGGPELCQLPILTACFHPSSPDRLLRIDEKRGLGGGVVELRLGRGRPINNVALIESALGKAE